MRRLFRAISVYGLAAMVAAGIGASPLLASQTQPVVVVPELANVRAGPGTVYDQLGVLTAGQSSPALGRSAASDWIQIQYPPGSASEGWVYAPFVELQGGAVESLPVRAAPPTPTLPPTPADQPDLFAVTAVLPTRLPTFTPASAVTPESFDDPEPGQRGIPWAVIILVLFGVGVFGAVMAVVRRR